MKYPFNCLFFLGVYKSSPLISCTYLLIQFLVSTVKCFLCKAGVLSYSLLLCLQGIFWKFELHRGGQKLIIPVRIFSLFLLFHFKMHPFSSIPVRIGWIEWKAIRTFLAYVFLICCWWATSCRFYSPGIWILCLQLEHSYFQHHFTLYSRLLHIANSLLFSFLFMPKG